MIETTEIEKPGEGKTGLPSPLLPLARLAWNYWWSWAPDGPSIFRDLDPETWEECEHNPRQLLASTSGYRLAQAATDPLYIDRSRISIKNSKRTLNTHPHGRHPTGRSHPNIRSLTSVRSTAFTTRFHCTPEGSAYSRETISSLPAISECL